MRVAAIDVGTNTALLLVADVGEGRLEVVLDQTRTPRLGQGVDRTGRLDPAAIERVVEVLAEYRERAGSLGAERILATATSAARDATNRDELLARSPVPVRVLTGAEEASVTLAGGLSGFPKLVRGAVLDIGGGSTELALGTRTGVAYAVSLQLGTVRLTERMLSSRPARPDELARTTELVDRELQVLAPPRRPEPLLAVAGTPCAVACLETGCRLEDSEGVVLTHDAVRHGLAQLARLTSAEALALAPEALAGRSDVILAGALILERVMTRLALGECIVSGRGVRHGVALQLAAEPG